MIGREEVLHVARLARLRLKDGEVEPMARELSGVLDHIAKIGELSLDLTFNPPRTSSRSPVACARTSRGPACRGRWRSNRLQRSYTLAPGTSEATSVRQITAREADIQWHVHLANLKSFTRDPARSNRIPVVNDPGVKTVSVGESLEVVGAVFGADVQLGTLQADETGVLRVLGGFGRSESPGHPGAEPIGLYSPDWFDDVADGPVRATIRLRDTGEMPRSKAHGWEQPCQNTQHPSSAS